MSGGCWLFSNEFHLIQGLYKKARAGKIANFTAISAPYEEPREPDLVLETSLLSVEDSTRALVERIRKWAMTS